MITVFVPAFNEAENIQDTVQSILTAGKAAGDIPLEIIVVNDGSSDNTWQILGELSKKIPNLRPINNEVNLGVGQSLRKALALAQHEKFLIVPGDNDLSQDLITNLFKNASKADLIMSYFLNREVRGVRRNIISNIFGSIYMITFSIFVQYINGPCVYPTKMMRALDLKSNRFSIVVETTIKLLRSGCTYYEVPGYMQKGLAGSTSLSFRNLTEVIFSYFRLVKEVVLCGKGRFDKVPRRIY